ncbi:thiol-disulfide oxidoreductase DCC family protein [Streptomyces xanthii]|uniref:thiol-disulfide oxidoreductase DCC family protein n=1 Tax=Streptomyces xanthii TaxID=2768069 RepID=UPI00374E0BD1
MNPVARDARGDVPVRRLTVLYDADCPLCTFARGWLGRQRQLVPLEFVAAGSDDARARYPGIDHAATLGDITVIGDGGQVFQGSAAWVVCMWALREHRATAHRMTTPAGMKVAKQVVLAAAKYREAHRTRQAGGGVYRREDGWTYDPRHGWTFEPPASSPERSPDRPDRDGWFQEAYGYGDGAPVCDSGCRTDDPAD